MYYQQASSSNRKLIAIYTYVHFPVAIDYIVSIYHTLQHGMSENYGLADHALDVSMI